VAYALGCEFEDCRLDDDGRVWPVSISIVEIKYPQDWQGREAFTSIAMIHEAGAMAVARRHGHAPHRVNPDGGEALLHSSLVWDASTKTEASGALNHLHNPLFMAATRTGRTAAFLDVPLIWSVIEALAQFIEVNDGALGTNAPDGDSAALKLIKDMGLTPGWAWSDGRTVRPKPQIVP
jgi:hypothetical protein